MSRDGKAACPCLLLAPFPSPQFMSFAWSGCPCVDILGRHTCLPFIPSPIIYYHILWVGVALLVSVLKWNPSIQGLALSGGRKEGREGGM